LGHGTNIIATKTSHAANGKTLVVSAHYDTISNYTGAIDNASGVTAVLEAARVLQNYELPFNVTYVLFDAEEAHLSGSDYYVKQLTEEQRAAVIGNINLDMVAEKDAGDFVFITPLASHSALTYLYDVIISPDDPIALWGLAASDSASFEKAGLPALTLYQNAADYSIQTAETDLDKMDLACLRAATEIAVKFITGIDLQKYEQILSTLPSVDLGVEALNTPSHYNDHNIKKGAIDGFSFARAYSKLLPGGVYSEFYYMFRSQEGREYAIRQIPSAAAIPLDASKYTKKTRSGGYFMDYYLYSDGGNTTLYIGNNLSFQTIIFGNISGPEAEAVFFNILRE
jgi:hypothetical protein